MKPHKHAEIIKAWADGAEIEWKFKRDTKKRGYSQSEVLDALQRRQGDENNFITPQKHNADVIVKFTKDQHYAISLLYFSQLPADLRSSAPVIVFLLLKFIATDASCFYVH